MTKNFSPSLGLFITTGSLLLASPGAGCSHSSPTPNGGPAVAIADAGAGDVAVTTNATDVAGGGLEARAPDPSAAMLKPEDALIVLASAQGHLGDCAVGIAEVTGTSFVAWVGNLSVSRHPLRKGDVLVCQGLFRVVEVGDVSAYAPGATRPGVVIDKRPRSIPGLGVQADSIILNVAGKTDWQSTTFSNIQIASGKGSFEITDSAVSANSGFRSVAVGDLIPLVDGSHKVLAVVAPDPAGGVGGWIEISGKP